MLAAPSPNSSAPRSCRARMRICTTILGLAYFDLRDYDNALDRARSAYRLGFPLPGLRNKLQEVGKWQNVETPATSVAPDKQAPEAKPVPEAPATGRTGS